MGKLRNTQDHSENLAVILIDYDNLTSCLDGDSAQRSHVVMLGMLEELRRYLTEELRIKPVRTVCYGDYGLQEDAGPIMDALAVAGVEIRHIPSGVQASDPATRLTIDTTELLQSRSDLSAFVVLSGDNWYIPLIQHLQRFGKFVLVAALDLPPSMGTLWSQVSDAFLNGRFLLDPSDRDAVSRRRTEAPSRAAESTRSRAPSSVTRVEDAGAFRTLELIDEYFGQYEEIYLTPLLRKMSELLDEEDGEPKDLVNLLQEAGVVWLEKRRGFPYDYTVLLLNDDHPDLIEVRSSTEESSHPSGDYSPDYGEDDEMEEDHEYERH